MVALEKTQKKIVIVVIKKIWNHAQRMIQVVMMWYVLVMTRMQGISLALVQPMDGMWNRVIQKCRKRLKKYTLLQKTIKKEVEMGHLRLLL